MALNVSNLEFKLLQILIEKDQYQSVNSIAEQLNFSRRSTYYYMKSVSEKLIKNKIDPPRNVKGQGYYLSKQSKEQLNIIFSTDNYKNVYKKQEKKFSAKERQVITIILMFGLSSYVTISKLAGIFNVTRNTIVNDFSVIKDNLLEYDFSVIGTSIGHHFTGNEFAIRNYFQDHLTEFLTGLNSLYKMDNSSALLDFKNFSELIVMIKDWMHKVEFQSSSSFSDDAIRSMENFYALVLLRILAKHTLPSHSLNKQKEGYEELQARKEFEMAGDFLAHIGIDTEEYKEEVFYLESLLLSSQLKEISPTNNSDIKKQVQKSTKQIINNFKHLAEANFKNEKQLKEELYVHMLSTYYRVKFNHQYKDSAVLSIKENYPEIYTYTSISIDPFEKLTSQPLNDNEIGLIAIYFGAHLLNQESRYLEILLVCSSGLGTSQLLKNQLATIFPGCILRGPVTKRDYDNFSVINSDVVISTIPLKEKEKQVIVVNPVMNEAEVSQLRKQFISDDLINVNGIDKQFTALMDVIADNTNIINVDALENGIKEVLSRSLNPRIPLKGGYQPLLSELLNEETIQFSESEGLNWEKAIRLAATPLKNNGNIADSYIEAMIENVKKNGPYINIGDQIALAHARPEHGVKELGMAVLKLNKPIDLIDHNHPIQLIFVLAAIDDQSHLKALSELANILNDKSKLQLLIDVKDSSDIQQLILEGEDQ